MPEVGLQLQRLLALAVANSPRCEKPWPASLSTLCNYFKRILSCIGIVPNLVHGVRDFDLGSLQAWAGWLMQATEDLGTRGWLQKSWKSMFKKLQPSQICPSLTKMKRHIFSFPNWFYQVLAQGIACKRMAIPSDVWFSLPDTVLGRKDA